MHELGDLPAAAQLARLWDELAAGAESGRHPFHTMTLATVAAGSPANAPVENGTAAVSVAAEARTVVLRAVDPVAWQMSFHTDARSPKVAQIAACPGVTLLFYDTAGRRQVRARGVARVHQGNARSRERWAAVPERSRICYRSPDAPGAPVSREVATPNLPDPDAGYAAFAVVDVAVAELELLLLDHREHQRCLWVAGSDPARPRYLAP